MPKIATKTGDKGTTKTLFGQSVPKNHTIIEIVGSVDVASAFIGVAKCNIPLELNKYIDLLEKIQKDLILIMGQVNAVDEKHLHQYLSKFQPLQDADLEIIEKEVELLESLPELEQKDWVLYGTNIPSAHLDVASKQIRMAECSLFHYYDAYPELKSALIMKYINRVSDLLYLMARYCSKVL